MRGALGAARDGVLGKPTAPARTITEIAASTSSPKNTPKSQVDDTNIVENQRAVKVDQPAKNLDRKQPSIGTALKNVGGFFLAAFAWCCKNPVAAIGLALLILFLLMGRGCSPFEFGKSKGELRLERELAEANARVLEIENERDAEIAQVARDVAVIRAQIRIASQRGHDEIAAAAPANEAPIAPELVSAFRSSLDRLCVQRADGSLPNPCGSGASG